MRKTRRKPSYDLELVKGCVSRGAVSFSRRPRKFIQEHYGFIDYLEVVKSVFNAMRHEHFVKSDELEYLPGTYADIYSGMKYDDIEWYVKFFMRDGEVSQVEIWSMNWDGTVH